MQVFHDSFYAMGTRLDVVIPNIHPDQGRHTADKIRAEVNRLERKLSRFDPNSSLSFLNQDAGARPVGVGEEMTQILELCLSYFESTNGAFDITMSPLNALWTECATRAEPSPPSQPDITAAKEATGMDKVEIDTHNQSVRFHHPDLAIDLGGFGKGYALEQVRELLNLSDLKNAFICFGDSAVLGCGHHPHGTNWDVGVKHLFDQTRTVRSFQLSDESLSTSGTTPNNKRSEAPWHSHLISPQSGRPVIGHRTVSVVSPSALDAEVLSTALLVTPADDRNAIFCTFADIQAVEFEYSDSQKPVLSWSAGLNQDH